MILRLQVLQQLWEYLATCPWLWWLGMSENPVGLRRRATDASIMAKLVPVLLVPLLTAAATAYVTVKVLETKIDMYMHQTDERLKDIEKRLWDMRTPGVSNGHSHDKGRIVIPYDYQ